MFDEIANLGLQAYSAYSASEGQEKANAAQMSYNAAEAQKQRDWEQHMFQNRYQYTRKDLEAAGYNPIMALGLNPSVPSGASASATPQSTKKESSQFIANSAKAVAEMSLTRSMISKTSSEAKTAAAHAKVAEQQAAIETSDLGRALAVWRNFLDKSGAGKGAQNIINLMGGRMAFKAAMDALKRGRGPRITYGVDRRS